MNGSPRICIIIRDELFRRWVSNLLKHAGYEALEYEVPSAFLDASPRLDVACILFDPKKDDAAGRGISWVERLAAEAPVIALIEQSDPLGTRDATKSGAEWCIQIPPKPLSLLATVRAALQRAALAEGGGYSATHAKANIAKLTAREREVLQGLMLGLSNKEIANHLGISPRTIEVHRAHMMSRLGVHNLAETLKLAFAAGLQVEGD